MVSFLRLLGFWNTLFANYFHMIVFISDPFHVHPAAARAGPGVEAAVGASYSVMDAFVGGALQDLAASLECEDDDEGEEAGEAARASEWTAKLALLGRISSGRTLSLLAGMLGQKLHQLQHCAASGQFTPLYICLHCLAPLSGSVFMHAIIDAQRF
eukprot:scaffold375755_cov38-Prasinocladus_malaysianus.AAC.1